MEQQFAPDRCTWGRLPNIALSNVDVNMQSLGLHFISRNAKPELVESALISVGAKIKAEILQN
jgi:hypothetical protein